MLYGYILLAVALTISAVAAFYSIMGLTAIFAAAVLPIIIMGAALEIGKVATTVWLHKYWHQASWQFKVYLVPAIVVLMLITSMGIFGFLSKAHLDQAVPAGDVAAQVAIFDDKIKTERDNIAAARQALQQMDAQVNAKLDRTTDDRGAERAVQIRRQQSKERAVLQKEISEAQKRIVLLQEQRAPIAQEVRKVEAEVGPIKYIAALIYGDNPDQNTLEAAVRWVIILLVLVFDPLALVLILAAEQTFTWHRERKEQAEIENFFARGRELAQRIDDNDGKLTDDDLAAMNIQPPEDIEGLEVRPWTEEEITALDQPTEIVLEEAPGLKKKLMNLMNKLKGKPKKLFS